jgi:YD repeat-containing protein
MRRLRSLQVMLFLFLGLLATPLVAGTTTHQYDEVGRLVRVDYESGASIRFVYDAAGNMLERVITLADDPVDVEVEPEPEIDVTEAPPSDTETTDAPVDGGPDLASTDLFVHVDAGADADASAELPSGAEPEPEDSPSKGSGCMYGASAPQPGPAALLASVLLLLVSWRRVSGLRRGEG